MGRITVKLNSRGVRELLGSPGVRGILDDVAHKVAGRAGAHATVRHETTSGYRAVAIVEDAEPGAMRREADTGNLSRALGG